MAKKKPIQYNKKANILIYDDENIKYYQGTWTSIEASTPNYIDCSYISDYSTRVLPTNYDIHIISNDLEEFDNINLDDTTMKRIAKFNKQQECKRLDKEMEEKQKRIKELDNLLHDKEKRWNKVKEYIKNIYEINLYDDTNDYDYNDD